MARPQFGPTRKAVQERDYRAVRLRPGRRPALSGYRPKFTVTSRLSAQIAAIAAIREKLLSVKRPIASDLDQRRTRGHQIGQSSGTDGQRFTLERVRAMANGEDFPVVTERQERQVLAYFAMRHFRENKSGKGNWTQKDVLRLHRMVTLGEMDQGIAGKYRSIAVRTGRFVPPPPVEVPQLMFELLEWWNTKTHKLPSVLISAVIHYRISEIHPFSDGNGRLARAVSLWELYRDGFWRNFPLSLNGHYWGKRRHYYAALRAVSRQQDDLTGWLEYSAERLKQQLRREWNQAR